MERQLALYDPLAARYTRTCLRCGQSPKGRSYSTIYGYIWVVAPGPTLDGSPYQIKVHGCGEICHHICPAPGSPPREIFHDPAELGKTKRHYESREVKAVSRGIMLLTNGRYGARVGPKRLGTHKTQTEAETARDLYNAEIKAAKQRQRTLSNE